MNYSMNYCVAKLIKEHVYESEECKSGKDSSIFNLV